MPKFIFKRLLMMIPVLIGVLFIVFTLSYITPGDPARMLLGERAQPEAIATLREEMGLNDPFLVQFGKYITRIVRFDFGTSYVSKRLVSHELFQRFPTTLHLAFLSIVITLLIGLPLGVISATKQYSIIDSICTIFGLTTLSVPYFWLGLMFMLFFSVKLNWLPATGYSGPIYWIMPSFTVGLVTAGTIMRFTRSSMLEVIRQDYIRTARAKGQKELTIIMKHALKNAMIPVITVTGIQFGYMIGGAMITETIFNIPGIGSFIVQSIRTKDGPIVQGGVLLSAVALCFLNLFVDILYAFVDPRIRSQYK